MHFIGGLPFYNPLVYIPGVRRKVHTYRVDLPAILCERKGVLLLLYLLHGLLSAAVQLELHHIHISVGLKDQVYPAAGCMVFHLCIESGQTEHDEKHVLVVQLDILGKFIGAVSQK